MMLSSIWDSDPETEEELQDFLIGTAAVWMPFMLIHSMVPYLQFFVPALSYVLWL